MKRNEEAIKVKKQITKFDGEFGHENPYRAEAMLYIIEDMDVPEELKQKIKLEDEAYKRRLQDYKT